MSHEALGGGRGEGGKSRDMPHYVFFIYQEKCKCLILFISHAAVPFSCKGWVIFIWHLIICVSRESFGGRGEGGKSRDMPYYQKKCKNLMLFISHASLFTL